MARKVQKFFEDNPPEYLNNIRNKGVSLNIPRKRKLKYQECFRVWKNIFISSFLQMYDHGN
jgi:hypothetical protein